MTAPTIEGVGTTRNRIEAWSATRFGPGWKDRVSVVSDETRLGQATKALLLFNAAAFAITAIMRHVANAPVRAWLSASTVVTAIGASVAIGLIFGLYPALRAARLSPIDAIHHE